MALLGLPHISYSDFLKIHHLQLVDNEIGMKTGSLKAARGKTDQDEESPISFVYIIFISVITTITIIMFLGPQGTHGIPSLVSLSARKICITYTYLSIFAI